VGDAPKQGPAREEVLSASPKSANPEKPANAASAISNGAPVIELASAKSKAVEAETRETGDLVTTRPKPEKRKNAKERAKAKFSKAESEKDKTAEDGTTPMTAKAKSEADLKKAERKEAHKAAAKVAKAERKAKEKTKRTAAKAA
jgi:hypothetical protein